MELAETKRNKRKIEYKVLGEDQGSKELDIVRKHSHAFIWGFKI